jgi:hypothetical protein
VRYPARKETEDIKEIRSERALDVHADTILAFAGELRHGSGLNAGVRKGRSTFLINKHVRLYITSLYTP